MSITESIPDLTSFLVSLSDLCLAGAFVGCVIAMLEAAFIAGFPPGKGKENRGAGAEPAVTILKPLHDGEPGLPVRLAVLCRQDYGSPVQVVCGVTDQAAPAAAVVRTVQRDVADGVLELAVDPRLYGLNRKVSNLINMMPRARHDMLVLSDSDIVVGRRYLRDIAACFSGPRVGAVTCLYYGIGGDGLWGQLSALAINSHFLPQAITAISLGLAKPCCGATIALRRSTLDRIGGFGAFADVLADDHAMGVAVRAAGYDVLTAPFLVGHRCFEGDLWQFVRHQMRVARTIRSIDPVGYAGTILAHPWPLALLGLLSGSTAAVLIALAVLVSRIALCRCVERRFGLPRQRYWLIPLQDVMAFTIYVASFFGATVHWRGSDYRVAADGTLIEDKT